MAFLEFNGERGARRVRVWLDELPIAAILPDEAARESHIFACGSTVALRRSAVIEIFRYYGGSFHYGLLGGEYRPTQRGALEALVPLDTPFPERRYTNSLAGRLDSVTIGSHPEFAMGIWVGLQQVDVSARPCGVLDLKCMAHGHVGSAQIVFDALARAMLVLLCRSDQPTSLEEVMVLLDPFWRRRAPA